MPRCVNVTFQCRQPPAVFDAAMARHHSLAIRKNDQDFRLLETKAESRLRRDAIDLTVWPHHNPLARRDELEDHAERRGWALAKQLSPKLVAVQS